MCHFLWLNLLDRLRLTLSTRDFSLERGTDTKTEDGGGCMEDGLARQGLFQGELAREMAIGAFEPDGGAHELAAPGRIAVLGSHPSRVEGDIGAHMERLGPGSGLGERQRPGEVVSGVAADIAAQGLIIEAAHGVGAADGDPLGPEKDGRRSLEMNNRAPTERFTGQAEAARETHIGRELGELRDRGSGRGIGLVMKRAQGPDALLDRHLIVEDPVEEAAASREARPYIGEAAARGFEGDVLDEIPRIL